MPQATEKLGYIAPRDVRPLHLKNVPALDDLRRIGIGIDEGTVMEMMKGLGMDAGVALQGLTTSASITTPVQFIQQWLPGFVAINTAARKIDELVGIMTAGSWEDEEVVQGIMENTGSAVPYGDYSNVPFGSWNLNFERRSVVRFEEGIRVGKLEEARAAKVRANSAQEKRQAASRSLEIQRNSVGFVGYNGGNNRTYGFLTDPNLPAYVTVATGVGGYLWSQKTFNEIVTDILTAIVAIRTNSKDTIDPEKVPLTLALPTAVVDRLGTVNSLGTISVRQWLKETYPNIRVVSAPELNVANGGANVFYLYAETVDDGLSSDGGATFIQVVPAKFQVLGVAKLAKFYEEDYSNATAGIMCKRPYAVYRGSGI